MKTSTDAQSTVHIERHRSERRFQGPLGSNTLVSASTCCCSSSCFSGPAILLGSLLASRKLAEDLRPLRRFYWITLLLLMILPGLGLALAESDGFGLWLYSLVGLPAMWLLTCLITLIWISLTQTISDKSAARWRLGRFFLWSLLLGLLGAAPLVLMG